MTWQVHNADCVGSHGLGELALNSVDVAIFDPPYSPHVHECRRRGKAKSSRTRFYSRRAFEFEALTPSVRRSVAFELSRLVRRWVLVFADVEGAQGWVSDLDLAGFEYVRTCFWFKYGASPQFTGDRPASHAEAIVCAHQRHPNGKPMRKRWNGGGRGNVFLHPTVVNRTPGGVPVRSHTAQKPLKLMRELVELFSDPGELVVDPFAGSGTTGVAAKQLGRSFVGFEVDEHYAHVANERLAKTHHPLAIRPAARG